MALSQAAIKRNREANKRAKEKYPRGFYMAGPSKEEREESERSRKNKEAAIKMAETEIDAEILGSNKFTSYLEGALSKAKTSGEKDRILARFLDRVKAQQEITKKNKATARRNIAQFDRDDKEIEAGVEPKRVYERSRRIREKFTKGGSVKKYAKGGGVRKARYK